MLSEAQYAAIRDAYFTLADDPVTALCALVSGWLDAARSEGAAAPEATLHMAVARLGGEVEGAPTHRINFLQRIDELRKVEALAGLDLADVELLANLVRAIAYSPENRDAAERVLAALDGRKEAQPDTLDRLAAETAAWAIQQFPKATPESWTAHIVKEAAELEKAPRDPEEMADLAMLIFGLAAKVGVNLAASIRAKLEENKLRKWGEPDAQGVVEHVREAPPEPAPPAFDLTNWRCCNCGERSVLVTPNERWFCICKGCSKGYNADGTEWFNPSALSSICGATDGVALCRAVPGHDGEHRFPMPRTEALVPEPAPRWRCACGWTGDAPEKGIAGDVWCPDCQVGDGLVGPVGSPGEG